MIWVVLGNTRIGGHETVVWSAVWYLEWCCVRVLGGGNVFDSEPGEVSYVRAKESAVRTYHPYPGGGSKNPFPTEVRIFVL